jgi:menaquinone-specific isochorismate synthase
MIRPEHSVCMPDQLPRALESRIYRLLRQASDDRIVRLLFQVPLVDPLDWLAAQAEPVQFYWADRDLTLRVAAVGVVEQYEGPGTQPVRVLEQRLHRADTGVRFFGGGRFDVQASQASYWRSFGLWQFWLPRFELWQQGDRCWLACNLIPARDRDAEALSHRFAWPEMLPTRPLPLPLDRTDLPDYEGWRRNVQQALQAFQQGRLEKVVLARQVCFTFGEPLDSLTLMQRLEEATPGCFHFYYQPEPGKAFLGASPERRFRRADGQVWSEAVAGTRPRGQTEADDARLAAELLESEKDRREQYYVQQSILEELRSWCETLEVDTQLSEMTLARGRHLYTGIRGRLHPQVSTAVLLEALHPTPAVGGYPRQEALVAIRNWEPFDRGWYAGPIGWIGAETAEFAVAIRSGLIDGSRLYLYSGAGIVEGSIPELEWAEIEHKISDFVNVLGLELRRS